MVITKQFIRMKIQHLFGILALCLALTGTAQTKYVEPEEKDKIIAIYPEAVFDSLQARAALAEGTGTIRGVAYTKPRTKFGYKAPLGAKIKANRITIQLFPVTPYLEEWLSLRKKRENAKKRIHVYMSSDAYRYRLEAVTNSDGKFTFPKMKPGRYFLTAIMGYDEVQNYNVYTGSGYSNYGGQIDYYEQRQMVRGHSERLEKFVDVKEDGQIVEVKLN